MFLSSLSRSLRVGYNHVLALGEWWWAISLKPCNVTLRAFGSTRWRRSDLRRARRVTGGGGGWGKRRGYKKRQTFDVFIFGICQRKERRRRTGQILRESGRFRFGRIRFTFKVEGSRVRSDSFWDPDLVLYSLERSLQGLEKTNLLPRRLPSGGGEMRSGWWCWIS